jgi:hypothetical protein
MTLNVTPRNLRESATVGRATNLHLSETGVLKPQVLTQHRHLSTQKTGQNLWLTLQ